MNALFPSTGASSAGGNGSGNRRSKSVDFGPEKGERGERAERGGEKTRKSLGLTLAAAQPPPLTPPPHALGLLPVPSTLSTSEVVRFKNDAIFKIKASEPYLAPASMPHHLSFRKGQAFYALNHNDAMKCFFVSTEYATPFSRTAVNGFVPDHYFEVVELNTGKQKKDKEKAAAAAAAKENAAPAKVTDFESRSTTLSTTLPSKMTSQKQQDVLQQSLKSTAATPNSSNTSTPGTLTGGALTSTTAALNSVSSAKSYLQHIQQQQARANAAARLKEDGAELEEELRNTSSQAELSKALLQQQLLQQQHELARKVSLKKGDAPPPPTYVPTSSFQAVTGAAGGAQHHLSQAFHNMLIPPPPPASAVPAIPTMSLLSRDSMPPVPLNSDSSVLLQFTTNPSAQQNATPINPVKQTATMATTMSVPTVPSSTFSKATQSPAASLTSSEPVSVAPKPHSPSIVSKASNTSSGGVRGASFFKMLANLLHSSNSSHSNLTSATPTAADGSNGAVGFLNTKRKTAASSSHTTTTTPVARTNTIAATQQYLQQSYYQQQRSKSPGPPKSPASKSPGLYQPKTPRTPGGGIVGSFGFRSTSTSSTAPTAGIVYNTNTHSINNSLPPPSQHAPPQSSSFNRTPNAPTAVPSAVPYFAISKSPGGMSSCPTSPAAAVANSSIGSGLDTQAPPMPVIPAVYLQDSGGVPGAAGESVFVPSDADLRMYPGALGSAVIAAAVRSASGGGASGAPTPVPQVIRSVSPASGVGGMVGATPAATVADSTPTGQGSGNGRQLKSSLKKAASSFWG